MDYEKKYKEALERAKMILCNVCEGSASANDIETIFPELAESEDERIRKAILGLTYIDGIEPILTKCSITARDIRAYLERQKDASKAIEAVDRIDKYIDENVANAHDMKDSNPDKKYYRGWDDALGKMAGILQDVYSDEKQKEQKPVEHWQYVGEVDFEKEKAIEILEDYLKWAVSESEEDCSYTWNELANAIRLGIDAMKEQKPTGWSKNDTVFLNEITDFFENKTVRLQHDLDMYAHWLKSLPERFNLQPKHEWIAWLNYLRPQSHWKPSKEQVEALEKAIIKAHSTDEIPILTELRQQLKKLI